METMNYQKQATDFLEKHGIEFSAEFVENAKYFEDDKEPRDIYNASFKRNGRQFSVRFGQSIDESGFYYTKGRQKIAIDRKHIGKTKGELLRLIRYSDRASDVIHLPVAPTAYDVLACLEKYPTGEFEDFCSEFGYDTDSRKAKKTYKAVLKEWVGVNNFFTGSEIEEMQEIQ